MITVMGQVAFQFLVAKPLAFFTRKRKAQIIMDYQLDTSDFPADKMHKVESVNAPGTIQLIQEINPDLIIVNGTRTVSYTHLDVYKRQRLRCAVACRSPGDSKTFAAFPVV